MQCSQYCARPAKTADCGLVQPCATQDHEWKKADAGSFVGDIDLLVIITDANSNKTKTVPAAPPAPLEIPVGHASWFI